jgi:hypothetical protein
MNGRKTHWVKPLAILTVSLVAWVAVTLTIVHWWSVRIATDAGMSTTEFFLHEMARNIPHYVYFLIIGSIFALLLDARASVTWALLAATLAMWIYALMSHWTFYEGPSLSDIALLLVEYVLPLAFAVAGALIARSIKSRRQPYGDAET